ncbi:MAG: hypothetical protein JWN04_1053 [Myxococcaceae bacterium]|nr:hypothetical protein [Myxococcaceae bacterium]
MMKSQSSAGRWRVAVGMLSLLATGNAYAEPNTEAGWTDAFQNEHNTAWSGSDQGNSIRTTGNNQVYFIHGDTYTMDEQIDSGGRGAGAYLEHSPAGVNNSLVRYIWYGADVVEPATAASEAVPSPPGTHLWGMDLTEANGAVYALLADGTNYTFNAGGYLAKFDENSDGTLTRSTDVIALPFDADRRIHWNNSIVNLSDTIYVYGSDDLNNTYVSRIPAGAIDYGFLGSWDISYFTSNGWSADQAAALPISAHVFRSVRAANGYLAATYRDNGYEAGGAFGMVRTATDDPEFQSASQKSQTFTNPLVEAGQYTSAGNVSDPAYSVRVWTYCPTLHPELAPSSDTSLLVAIAWNVWDYGDTMKNAQAYKPRFFTVPSPNVW